MLRSEQKKNKKRKSKIPSTNLSFEQEDSLPELDDSEKLNKKQALKKDPYVNTSFLPDKQRDELIAEKREIFRSEWLQEQERIKNEEITVAFSYWDGSGHRYSVSCKKGDSISTFLEKSKLVAHQIRGANVENLMFIKEDLIIPHHYTFYDFIVNKVRGKSGPLFNFTAYEDIRLVNDATVEKQDSHVGKICERHWYERNKHIFPANRWELYNPELTYGPYTIKDKPPK
ncbi:hypothetical protein BB560_000243 [Smittium megazygosporum]|uniref:FAM50A/XAP5 C-terminal domain-containing protein n=1 Tax=Smittium megazygosporum TaxID=133381 RepID=A0A2T9ZL07_9FUNG|nr:hypothetical protein BB560_000243 [Smittium megazygosporum]